MNKFFYLLEANLWQIIIFINIILNKYVIILDYFLIKKQNLFLFQKEKKFIKKGGKFIIHVPYPIII